MTAGRRNPTDAQQSQRRVATCKKRNNRAKSQPHDRTTACLNQSRVRAPPSQNRLPRHTTHAAVSLPVGRRRRETQWQSSAQRSVARRSRIRRESQSSGPEQTMTQLAQPWHDALVEVSSSLSRWPHERLVSVPSRRREAAAALRATYMYL